MPKFTAYVSTSTAAMLAEIMANRPQESISAILARGVRTRHSQLFSCRHRYLQCMTCGREVGAGGHVPPG